MPLTLKQHWFVMLLYLTLGILLIGIAVLVFDQERAYWASAKEPKFRTPLTPSELQQEYLPDVPLVVLEKLLEIVADQFGENPQLVRPQDNHFLINDDLDSSTFIAEIERTFGISLADVEVEGRDGSFGSIARLCAKRCATVEQRSV